MEYSRDWQVDAKPGAARQPTLAGTNDGDLRARFAVMLLVPLCFFAGCIPKSDLEASQAANSELKNQVAAKAAHNVLKVRGKWRENIPGVEWFNTTVAEVEAIIAFVTEG